MRKSQSSRPLDHSRQFYCGPIDFIDPMGRHLLQGITLTLTPPCLCVITGPSGSGKTSLLRAICGLNKAQVHKRILDGKAYPDKKLPQWRAKVTLLLQDAPCIQGTIEQNLAFPFSFRNSPYKHFKHQEAKRLLKQVGLDHFDFDHNIEGLSGGERHRLALVRGLLWSPPVLLCDEPLSGLEPELADRCFQLLLDFSRTRPAIVLCVLHEERFARLANITMRLKDGTLHRT